jgi:ArsR family transcriptional regulator
LAAIDVSMIADQSKVVNMTECCPPLLAAPLAESDAEDLAAVFAALADPVRLRLLSLVADAGEVCSCNLLEPLGKAQPTVSHHTKVLAEAGLICGEKRGRWVWWRIVPERLDAVRESLALKVNVGG